MLKIKDDVPLINLIDMGFVVKEIRKRSICSRWYGCTLVQIDFKTKKIECFTDLKWYTPKMYDHCIRDLVQKQYVEEIK